MKSINQKVINLQSKLVRIRKSIIRELNKSKTLGNAIGIYSSAFDDEMVLSEVKDIYTTGNDNMVVLKWYDITGHILSQTHVALDEIFAVAPVNMKLKSPISLSSL